MWINNNMKVNIMDKELFENAIASYVTKIVDEDNPAIETYVLIRKPKTSIRKKNCWGKFDEVVSAKKVEIITEPRNNENSEFKPGLKTNRYGYVPRKVKTQLGIFDSAQDAAIAHNTSIATMYIWCRKGHNTKGEKFIYVEG